MFRLFGTDGRDFKQIFESFYENIMSNEKLSIFFKSRHQIRIVIEKQIAHFSDIHKMSQPELKTFYRKLGSGHAAMGISFSTIETASEYLFRKFLKHFSASPENIMSLEQYFTTMKSNIAYGYLQYEIEQFTSRLRLLNSYSSNTETLKEYLEWFMMLHTTILNYDKSTAESLKDAKPAIKEVSGSAKDLLNDAGIEFRNFDQLEGIMFFSLEKQDFKGTLATYKSLKESFLTLTYLLSLIEQNAMAESSSKDPLTGVLTRKQMKSLMDKAAAQSMITARPFTIAMTDIDKFKSVNDTYGHKAGDTVLRQFSALLVKYSGKENASIIRYGGEEFLIIFPDTTGPEALEIIENLRTVIEMTPINIGTGMIHITSSFGLQETLPMKGIMPEPLAVIKMADEKLYLAKEQGRNRSIL